MTRKGIPFVYFLLTGLTGMAAATAFFGWFYEFFLLFGIHMVSAVTMLVAFFFVMATGINRTGKLADKFLKPLHVLTIFIGIVTLFMFFHHQLFELVRSIYLSIIVAYHPGPFAIAIIRFMLTWLFFIIPAGLIAGSFPLYVTYFIRNIGQSGRYMSVTVLSVSLGILLGLMIMLVLMRTFGLHALYFSSGIIFAFIAAISIFHSYKNTGRNFTSASFNLYHQAKKTIRFKKKRAVIDASTKLTRAMLYGFVFQASIFGAMFIISIRMLMNYNVLKLPFFYSAVLGITISGMALGGILFNKIVEKPANKYLTMATLQIISGFGALLSYVILTILAGSFYQEILDTDSLTGLRQIVLFSLLLFIPAMLYGMSFPLAGKIYPKRIQQIGSAFGRLGKLIFVSFAVAAMITPFVIIPLMGLHFGFFFLSLMMLFSGIYLVFRDSRLIRVFRLGYALTAILLFVGAASTLRIFNVKQQHRILLKTMEGSTASFDVIEHEDKTRSLFVNGDLYFGTYQSSLKEQILAACIPQSINEHIGSALVIGFGSGITAKMLDEYGVDQIQIAEVFPEIIRLSSDVFSNENNDILTSSHVNIAIQDARSFLIASEKKYDLITSGTSQVFLLPGTSTLEFAKICLEKLTDKGIACMLLPVHDIGNSEFKSICKSWATVFTHSSIWFASPQKILLLGSREKLIPDYCRIASSFQKLNTGSSLTSIDIRQVESLLAHLMITDRQILTFSGKSPENSDDHPYVECNNAFLKDTSNMLKEISGYSTGYQDVIAFGDSCNQMQVETINQIRQFNELLLQQASLSSSGSQQHVVDFFEQKGLLFQQYP